MQTIGITGGTGFIGQHLTAHLVSKGNNVVIFTRSPARKTDSQITYAHWDVDRKTCDINPLKDIDAVISLAGAGIADKRLTEERKKEIVDSRVKSTDFLLSTVKQYAPKCKTIVAASAIGYYGPDKEGEVPFTETSPSSDDFLGHTCLLWEEASSKATSFLRTVIIRIGIVLGKEGGAYPQLAMPMSFRMMPILGSGRQVVSWVAVDDLVRMFAFALENEQIAGTYNAVAPNPVSHSHLMHTIAKAKGGIFIPAPVPSFLLRLMLGEMSEEVLKSCTVSSEKISQTGFSFECTDITTAIKRLC